VSLHFSVLNDVKLDILRNRPFPKIDVLPNRFSLDQVKQPMFLDNLLLLTAIDLTIGYVFFLFDIKSGRKNVTIDRNTCVNTIIVFG